MSELGSSITTEAVDEPKIRGRNSFEHGSHCLDIFISGNNSEGLSRLA